MDELGAPTRHLWQEVLLLAVIAAEVVAQVVRDLDLEWSGPAFALVLTGRGGGRWVVGEGSPEAVVTEDAVALMRLLSGRSDECVLATEGNAAAADRLRAARVVF